MQHLAGNLGSRQILVVRIIVIVAAPGQGPVYAPRLCTLLAQGGHHAISPAGLGKLLGLVGCQRLYHLPAAEGRCGLVVKQPGISSVRSARSQSASGSSARWLGLLSMHHPT